MLFDCDIIVNRTLEKSFARFLRGHIDQGLLKFLTLIASPKPNFLISSELLPKNDIFQDKNDSTYNWEEQTLWIIFEARF